MTVRGLRLHVLGFLGALLIAAGVLLAASGPASAHATLVGSTPADGSRLAQSPAVVNISFDEPVRLVPGSAKVLDATFSVVNDPGRAAASGATVRIPIAKTLAKGAYLVVWQVISADGHTVSGSLHFGVRADADAALAAPSTGAGGSGLDRAHNILGGFANGAAVLAIGVPLAALLVTRRRLAKRAVPLALMGAVAEFVIGAGLLLVDSARLTGSSFLSTAAFQGSQLSLHGEQMLWLRLIAVVMLAALLVVAGALERVAGRRVTDGLTGLALAALVISHAWLGHAAAGPWQWAAAVAAAFHVAAVAVWLGGLLLILAGLLRPDGRWSLIAGGGVVVIVVTGVIQTVRQVDPLESLWSTTYGLLLLTKMALLLLTICVVFGVRALLRRRGTLARPLVLIEITFLVIVLGVTGVLQSGTPAREDYGPALVASAPLGSDALRVNLDSTKQGPVRIRVARLHGGQVASLQKLGGSLTGDVSGPVTVPVTFKQVGGDSWVATAVLPAAGRWRLQLDAQIRAELAYATTISFRVW